MAKVNGAQHGLSRHYLALLTDESPPNGEESRLYERSLLTSLDRRVSLVPRSDRARVQLPIPAGTRRTRSATRTGGHGLRRDMSGSAPRLFL
jgi:hypothetical protein